MSGNERFTVAQVEPLRFRGPASFARCELMSPFVWRTSDGSFELLVRAVSPDHPSTGSIWHGCGEDGLLFTIGDACVLAPGPDGPDCGGCEDPTVVRHGNELIVFYTGVDAAGDGHLLWASGRDASSLRKRGVALTSFDGERDVKEAEVAVVGDHWTMGYEYARGGKSLIGYAEGDGPAGPWRETKHGFGPRYGRFDAWHLSPGPMLLGDPDRPIMFYNGATRDGVWGIGWVEFDHPRNRVVDRCDQPLIAPPGEQSDRDIAFAASLIEEGGRVLLYLSFNDRTCHRATLVQGDARLA